jgi:hypothetical protein
MTSGILVAIAYTYSYAQVASLRARESPRGPRPNSVLVTPAAYVSFASLFERPPLGVRGPPAQDVLSLEPGEWGKGLARTSWIHHARDPPPSSLERSFHVLRNRGQIMCYLQRVI